MQRLTRMLMISALAMGFLFRASTVSAHQDPANCNSNDFVVTLGQSSTVVYDETNPFGPTTITYTVNTGNPNTSGTGCSIGNVNVNLTTPDGAVHNLQTAGSYAIGTATAVLGTVNYNANSADKTGSLLIASVNVQGDLHDNPLGEDPQNITKQVSAIVINPSTTASISSSASQVLSGGTVNLTVTEENNGDVNLANAHVDVDNGVGTLNSSSANFSGDDGDGVLEPGETWQWLVNNVVVNSDTTFTATGHGTDPLQNDITYPGDAEERDSVDVAVLNPTTITTISASSTDVSSGSTVTLTVTEQNDGSVDLTNAHVDVDNGVGTLNSSSANFSGDDGDGVLEPGETWQWLVDVTVNAATTFTATGHGTDPLQNDITYPGDPEEQDAVTVNVTIVGCTLTQGYWKTHSDAWPVNNLNLGTVNYTAAQLLSIFNQPVKGNGLVSLAHQLIAAKLNIASGATPDAATAQAISDADAMIGSLIVPPVGSGKLSTSAVSSLVSILDSFNSGTTGPGHCSD